MVFYGAIFEIRCTNSEVQWNDTTILNASGNRTKIFTSSWAIRIPLGKNGNVSSLNTMADRIAAQTGLINHGQIGGLKGHYLLVHGSYFNRTSSKNKIVSLLQQKITKQLSEHPEIDWSRQEVVRMRVKRSLQFKDQYFPSQWHLVCMLFFFSFN